MGSEASDSEHTKSNISKYFHMIDLDPQHYCLHVEVWKTCSRIFLLQTKYAMSLLNRFRMKDCKISYTPMEKWANIIAKVDSMVVNELFYKKLVGSFIYLTTTSPVLSYTMRFISKFMTTRKVEIIGLQQRRRWDMWKGHLNLVLFTIEVKTLCFLGIYI